MDLFTRIIRECTVNRTQKMKNNIRFETADTQHFLTQDAALQEVGSYHSGSKPSKLYVCIHTTTHIVYIVVTTNFNQECVNITSILLYEVYPDFLLFLHLKSFLSGRQLQDSKKVKEAITTCLASQTASF